MNLSDFIKKTENLINLISRGGITISNRKIKLEVEKWIAAYSSNLFSTLDKPTEEKEALLYLKKSWVNKRLNRKKWLKNLRIALKTLKIQQLAGIKQEKISKYQANYIFSDFLLNKIKNQDKKIFVLGSEANFNWQANCWNACGILMRIILERVLDRKSNRIKQRRGLEQKINCCLSNKIFGKSVSDALKKLHHSTKITGDVVAHDSNILLNQSDIELAIVPLNMLSKDTFKL